MKLILLCFAAVFGVVRGYELGERRVIVSGDVGSPCVEDSDCFSAATTAASRLVGTHGTRKLNSKDSEEGGLRGVRKLEDGDPSCVSMFGI